MFKKHLEKARKIAIKTSGLNLPNSLLIIPDGNGRWAKHLGLAVAEGHKQGGKTISQILEDFVQVNIKVLGIWGFSEDNWKRDKLEIDKIMEVVNDVLIHNETTLMENGIKFICLGQREKLQNLYPKLFTTIEEVENKTKDNTNKTLALFLSYGEKFQLEEFARARQNDTESSTYDLLSKINQGLPLFDMVLRTSGEHRMSGFGPLASLAEFVSVNKNLPDLKDEDMIKALKDYSGRQRRFGGR